MSITIRIKGGIGNQLFMYAAARRLALINNQELLIDNISGFVNDKKYNRKYQLDMAAAYEAIKNPTGLPIAVGLFVNPNNTIENNSDI